MVLMLLVSVATVASFDGVGSVLGEALLVPASTPDSSRSSQESDHGRYYGRPRLCPRLSAEHLDSTSLARRIFESFGNNYGGGGVSWHPHVFLDMATGAMGSCRRRRSSRDRGRGYFVVQVQRTAATFPWSALIRILALAGKRGCFNHLLLVNTFSLTLDGPWPLKSRPEDQWLTYRSPKAGPDHTRRRLSAEHRDDLLQKSTGTFSDPSQPRGECP